MEAAAEARAVRAAAGEREAREALQRAEARAPTLEAAAAAASAATSAATLVTAATVAAGGSGACGGGGSEWAARAPTGHWPVDPETDRREEMARVAAEALERAAQREESKSAERLHRLFNGWERDPVRTGVRGKPGFRDGEKRGLLPRAEFALRVGLQPELEIAPVLLEAMLERCSVMPPAPEEGGEDEARTFGGSFGGKKLVAGPMVDVRRFAALLLAAAQSGGARLGDLGSDAAVPGYGREKNRASADALGKSYMANPWASQDDGGWNLRRMDNSRSTALQTMGGALSRHDSSRTGKLGRSEFTQALNGMGLNLSSWELGAVVEVADRDGGGQIDAAEFVATVSDFRQSASRILFGGAKKVRSGGVADALKWSDGAISAAELNKSDREVRQWLRTQQHLTFPS